MGHFGHRREAWHGIAGRTAIEAAVQPHGFQISFGCFLVRIFQIPAVLQGEVMLCPQRDDDGKTHALAF
jgi:hypothetical protein